MASGEHTVARTRRSGRAGTRYAERRLRLWRASFLVALAVLSARLFDLQILRHSHFESLSLGQARHTITIPALRGGIYDRYGHTIAISEPTSTVIADDLQITTPVSEARSLAPFLHQPVITLIRLLSEHNGYVVLTNSLDLADGRALANLYLTGITVQISSGRTYPNGTLMQSLVGRINASGNGSTGLEYGYNTLLAGSPGQTRELFSQSQRVALPSTSVQVIKKAVPGTGLELTIDDQLQYVTEEDLAKEVASAGALTGQAVVMDVKTGQILADASLVNTKTSMGVLGPISAWGQSVAVPGIEQTINNLPFSQTYEPGSVFKVVTFSAALQARVITPNSVLTVPNQVVVGTRLFHDAESHGLEHLSATNVLALSSNIGTYEIGTRVGENGLLAQVARMGFGQTTQVNYPGETTGLLVNASNWYAADQVALPIGQVDAVPAIQVLDAYNAIANGGVFVEPQLVRGLVQTNGSVTATPASQTRRVLSPSVASELNKMLQQVVLVGTGTNAIIPGYSVAGKTGTATMPWPGRDQLLIGQYNASFVGFAPANNPVLSMIVVIERPETAIYGGTVAAPVFQQVMSYALHHYGIPSSGVMVKPLTGSKANGSDIT